MDDTPVEPSQPVEKPDFFDKLVLYESYLLFGVFFLFIVYNSIINVERVIEALVTLSVLGSILYIFFVICPQIFGDRTPWARKPNCAI